MGNIKTDFITIGVVGLGLMGTSFIASMLVAGHEVKAIAPLPEDLDVAPGRITNQLILCDKAGLLCRPVECYLKQLVISEDYNELSSCKIVVECVIELPEVKASVYKKIEPVVSKYTVIASNTSAIPISELQEKLDHPERFLGMHWAEPSCFTRFMEIICGDRTDKKYADWAYELAHSWGKEPTLLTKDLRGFVTNRLMYAVYKEGLSLIEKGVATLEDVDKSFRYDTGSWITMMGIFRRMDFLGLKDYLKTFKTVFPQLCNDEHVPVLMQQMVDTDARGTKNLHGLYSYTEEEARKWDEAFVLFNVEIYQLAKQYPSQREEQVIEDLSTLGQYTSEV